MLESFKLPAGLPPWSPGKEFATGTITLGEIEVSQVSKFQKIWSCTGGSNKKGVAFYKPVEVPPGFFTLGHYCQPNNIDFLQGWLLVAKEISPPALGTSDDLKNSPPLVKPLDYTIVWSSKSWKGKKDVNGFFWLPSPPQGYTAIGFLVTNTPEKPSLEEVRCVRSDLTGACKTDSKIWGTASRICDSASFEVWSTEQDSEKQANGVSAGTFYCTGTKKETSLPLGCLKNMKSGLSGMPNLAQIHSIMENYGPTIFLHPDETYLPSSVSWLFHNGAVLRKKGTAIAEAIADDGSNHPQGGTSDDGEYWIDLPKDGARARLIRHGDLQSAEVYAHVKAISGGTFTDIAMWLFYPFNGPSTLVLFRSVFVPLGRIGRHIGDREHVTLRVNNFTGELWRVYLSQHSGGRWINAWDLDYVDGSNKPVLYSSRNGHANFSNPGLVLQGCGKLGVGIANESARSNYSVDSSQRNKVVAAEYLNSNGIDGSVIEPLWLNYARKWGPTIKYGSPVLVGCLDLPSELSEEDGPTGPKFKSSWYGDEK